MKSVLPQKHKHLHGCVLFCLLCVFICDVEPSPLSDGYTHTAGSPTGANFNDAHETSEGADSRTEKKYLHVMTNKKVSSITLEAGMLNYKDLNGGHKLLSGGVEANTCLVNPTWKKCLTSPVGAVARVNVAEKTFHTGLGPVDFNVGVKGDTGVAFNKGVEVKFVGIGAKIGADGINVCIFLCIGFSW